MPKSKVPIIISIFILFCLVNVLVFNYISDKQYNKKNSSNKVSEPVLDDIGDYNNVPGIDKKLGSDIKITQGYLMNYIIKKQGIWYMSYGYVKSIKKGKEVCTIYLSEDKNSKNSIEATISIDKCNIKANKFVHFVGTLDIETGHLKLSKIDTEEIIYTNVTELSINDLINNINLLRSNNFIVTGYLVIDNDSYFLYDSKDNHINELDNYFVIKWKDEVLLTENKNVNIKCNIVNSYTLNNCVLSN